MSNTENQTVDSTEPKKNPSPYDLNSSDTPGNVITQVQLKGANYDEWAQAVRISLRARRKWGFIDGTLKKPAEDSIQMEDWWTVHSMLVSWVMNTIEPKLRSSISYKENAKDLWEDKQERFSVINGPRIHQLRTELAETKQRGMTILSYYGKLKCLWEDLAQYDPLPSCSCANCTCDINLKLQKQRDAAMVHLFLMGLDEDTYGTIRSTLLAIESLPSINKVYSMLVQDESVRTMNRSDEEKQEQMTLASQTNNRNKSASKGRWDSRDLSKTCTHCNKQGHEESGCFEHVGYPNWWGDRSKKNTKDGSQGAGRGQINMPKNEVPRPGSNSG